VARPEGSRGPDYEAKRSALLQRMTERIMRRDPPHPSLRQLAEAAGVSVPTLRHYFGGRSEVIRAILAEYLAQGRSRLAVVAEPHGPFEQSIHQYGSSLIEAAQAPRAVRLGDVFALSMAEGMLDPQLGEATLDHIIDPSVVALQQRLEAHIQRGEMRPADTRAAALMLLSPLLLGVLHQHQMGGCRTNPADLDAVAWEVCAAFVRAYRA